MNNIILVSQNFPKITETFIYRQAQRLKAFVVTEKIDHQVLSKYRFPNYRINSLSEDMPKWVIRGYKLRRTLLYKLFGIPFYYWPRKFHCNFTNIVHRIKPTIVLAQFGPMGINVNEICSKLRIPLVIQFFGHDASSLIKNEVYRRELKVLFKTAAAIVVLTNEMKNTFVNIDCNPDLIHVIPVGVPVGDFYENNRNLKHGTTRFLGVGRLVEKKSPLDLIKAFIHCAEYNQNIHLDLVGDGPLKPKVIKLLRATKHYDKVSLLGSMPNQELRKYYMEAHVFLQHSVTDKKGNKEGWPVSIAEAAATGLPIIATSHSGIKDQVVHGITGYLVPEHDYVKMGEYMKTLSNDTELRTKMGAESRKHIEKYGNFELQIDLLEKLLANCLLKRS